MRPGIGRVSKTEKRERVGRALPVSSLHYGMGVVPVQPSYEAVRLSTAELLRLIQDINPATILSRQMQKVDNARYEMLWPEKFTEEWVEEHVHEVYMDDQKALADLRKSVAGNHPDTQNSES